MLKGIGPDSSSNPAQSLSTARAMTLPSSAYAVFSFMFMRSSRGISRSSSARVVRAARESIAQT
jgi:hypothetical protein